MHRKARDTAMQTQYKGNSWWAWSLIALLGLWSISTSAGPITRKQAKAIAREILLRNTPGLGQANANISTATWLGMQGIQDSASQTGDSIVDRGNAEPRNTVDSQHSTDDDLVLVYTASAAYGVQAEGSRGVQSEASTEFYVFSPPSGNGYAIVAGDDLVEAVLGYSRDAPFPKEEEMPEGLAYWLDLCREYVGTVAREGRMVAKPKPRGSAIAPLLGDIIWDQRAPYNAYTPKDPNGQHTPVGCVATALSQIMRYVSWPARPLNGTVRYSYQGSGGQVRSMSEQLGKHLYNWEAMESNYTVGTPSQASKDAVARLMYEVGAACRMNYSAKGSGAYSHTAANAVVQNFRYSNELRFSLREYMSRDAWEGLLLGELRAGYPVYYAGGSLNGAHAFVCDGYDGQGRFHFNWGWSGYGNGYFSLLDLDPKVGGTGAGGGSGYILGQIAISRFRPNIERGQNVNPEFIVDALKSEKQDYGVNETIPITIYQFFSLMLQPEVVTPALGIYDATGKLVKVAQHEKRYRVDSLFRGASSLKIPVGNLSLKPGVYTIRPLVGVERKSGWYLALVNQQSPQYLTLRVDGRGIHIAAESPMAKLRVTELKVGTLARGSMNAMRFTLRNEGNALYNSQYALRFANRETDSVTNRQDIERGGYLSALSLAPGTDTTITVFLKGPRRDSGWLQVLYDGRNGGGPNAYLPKNVLKTAQITYTQPIAQDGGKQLTIRMVEQNTRRLNGGEPLRWKAEVSLPTGTSGFFGAIIGYVSKPDAKSYTQCTALHWVLLKPGEKTTISMESFFSLPKGDYQLGTFYYYPDSGKSQFPNNFKKAGEKNPLPFTIVSVAKTPPVRKYPHQPEDDPSGLEAPHCNAILYPNPCEEAIWLLLPQEPIMRVSLLSIDGKLLRTYSPTQGDKLQIELAGLPAGSYLVHLDNHQGQGQTLRFVKL